MATLMGSPSTSSAERCSSKAQFRQLPFQLDLTCPIGLGTKNVAECVWPFSVALVSQLYNVAATDRA
jgi:hypothetical protein